MAFGLPPGGISIAGHKVPWEAIAALAGVAGVILVIRARQQGQNVVAAGQAAAVPYTAASSGFGSSFSPDYSGALANISQQLTSLTQTAGINGTPAQNVGGAPASFGHVTSDSGGGYILSGPNPAAAPLGFFSSSPLSVLGPAVAGSNYAGSTSPGLVGVASNQWLPVQYGGSTGYIWAPEAHINA